MLAWLAVALPIIADNVLGYGLDQSGVGEKIREKFRPDPVKEAFQHALQSTFMTLEQRYPVLAQEDIFRASFEDRRCGRILSQLLLRRGTPDSDELAALWASVKYPKESEEYTKSLNTFGPLAQDFLTSLDNALANETALQALYDSKDLTSIDKNVEKILHKLTDERDLAWIRHDYLHWLMERNMYLDLRGIPQTQRQVQVKLEEVYIALKAQRDEVLSTSERSLLENELQELKQPSLFSLEDIDDQRDLITHRFNKRTSKLLMPERIKGEVRDLSVVVAQHDHLLILGEPGSGKTTLLRYLALKHAQAIQNGKSEASSELGKARFPILLRIADYAEHGKGKSISDFLAVYCSLYECPHASTGLAEMFAVELQSGSCLILLDGLDEIVSIDDRMHVVRQIEDFVRHHSKTGNRFVITSRIAGYRNARLNGDYAHYQVQEMDDTQIRSFLDMWCPAVEYAQTPDLSEEARMVTAKREINGIMDAVEHTPGVRRLAANPLLLCTLALIHRTGAMLPQKRIELYKLAADVLTRTWRVAQGVRSTELLDEGEITKLLRELAYWMHVHKPTGIATEREIIKVWASVKGTDEDDLAEEQKVKAFLHQVELHTGLFVERAPKRYGFMHLTFEEYYAARYLVARSRTRVQLIRKHLHEPRWEEPILLALGFVGMDAPEDTAELIDAAILAQGELADELGFVPSKYEDLLARDYLFALRCLGDQMPMSEKTTDALVERLNDELLYESGLAKYSHYRQALNEHLEYLRGSKVASRFITRFLPIIEDTSQEEIVRIQGINSLCTLGKNNSNVVEALLHILSHSTLEDVRESIADCLEKIGTDTSKVIVELLNVLRLDPSEKVRAGVVNSLGELGKDRPEVVAELLNVMKRDPSGWVRYTATYKLGRLGKDRPEIVVELLNVLKHPVSENTRWPIPGGLARGRVDSSEVVMALLEVLQNDAYEHVLRLSVAESLGQLGVDSSEVVMTLLEVLRHDKSDDMRASVAKSLGLLGVGSSEVIAELLNSLQHDTFENVCSSAAESLGLLGVNNPEVMTVLMDVLRHNDSESIRSSIVTSLVQLEPEIFHANEITLVIFELLRSTNWWTRSDAVRLIGRLGKSDEQNLQALYQGLSDNENIVRSACVQGLVVLVRRFPDVYNTVEKMFIQAIEQDEFDKRDELGHSAHDYAYEGLWSLVVGGEIEDEEE